MIFCYLELPQNRLIDRMDVRRQINAVLLVDRFLSSPNVVLNLED